jgi:formylglycine-generating enzyme required for sulfatase activity
MSEKLHRYPGAKPFEIYQHNIFFGREKDVKALCRKLRQEPLTVLYSKSGMGKSSLLNAGVMPAMEAEGEYRSLRIRFNAFDREGPVDEQIMPILRCREIVRGSAKSANTFLDKLIPDEPSLWHDLKEQQLLATLAAAQTPGQPTRLLLLFDQFEELFTYPPEAVLEFRKQLAEALYTPLPSRYWDVLDLYGKEDPLLDEQQLQLLQKPLDLRVIMAIRQDRMHLLGQLADYLPSVSRTWYELRPLDSEQARAAILQPATLEGNFLSAPYRYEPDALESILSFLTDKYTEPVESTQLQIICDSLELGMAARSSDVLRLADVGDLEAVIGNYYLEKIATIGSESEQMAARRLIEEGLVYEEEERRLSLYEGIILKTYGVSAATLRNLVDCHLLRAEPSLQGGYTYELSHDTLVAPVLKARELRKQEAAAREAERLREIELADRLRKAEEEATRKQLIIERELRKEAESAKTEAENQRAGAERSERLAVKLARLAVMVSLLALVLAGFAGWFYFVADKEKQKAEDARGAAVGAQKEAEAAKRAAEANLAEAKKQGQKAIAATREAEKNFAAAQANLRRAEQEKKRAREALAQVEKEKEATEVQRRLAEENYSRALAATDKSKAERDRAQRALDDLAEANTAVVRLLLQNTANDILSTKYEQAYGNVQSAAILKTEQAAVAAAALELAFWFGETGNQPRADTMLHIAYDLLNKRLDTNQALRDAIESADKKGFDGLIRRYYPQEMKKIEGGTFQMGCTAKRDGDCTQFIDFNQDYAEYLTLHEQEVGNFWISRYETSWWQFRLFCESTGHYYSLPGWGIHGDNPVVNVNWYDAVEYANWLSLRMGLDTVYIIDKQTRDPNDPNESVVKNWKVIMREGVNGYRLPTEAEWEYAARVGRADRWAGCREEAELEEYAWYGDIGIDADGIIKRTGGGNSGQRTQVVGKKQPNAHGLYDMTGNVSEWCWDWFDRYPEQGNIGYSGPPNGSIRVHRGGSWFDDPQGCRVANRGGVVPGLRSYNLGFRLARTP